MNQQASGQVFCVVAWPGNELEAFPAKKDTAMDSAVDQLGPKGYSINSLLVSASCEADACQVAEQQGHVWVPPHQVMAAHRREAISRVGKPFTGYRTDTVSTRSCKLDLGDTPTYLKEGGSPKYRPREEARAAWQVTWADLLAQFQNSSWNPWKREKSASAPAQENDQPTPSK